MTDPHKARLLHIAAHPAAGVHSVSYQSELGLVAPHHSCNHGSAVDPDFYLQMSPGLQVNVISRFEHLESEIESPLSMVFLLFDVGVLLIVEARTGHVGFVDSLYFIHAVVLTQHIEAQPHFIKKLA